MIEEKMKHSIFFVFLWSACVGGWSCATGIVDDQEGANQDVSDAGEDRIEDELENSNESPEETEKFSDLQATGLRCEYLENPLGIDSIKPRLSWIVASDLRGRRQ